MTDPTLKPEDRALIERALGEGAVPFLATFGYAPSIRVTADQLATLLDAARTEGRESRASGEAQPVAWRFRSPEYGGTAPRWVYEEAEPKFHPSRGYTVQALYAAPGEAPREDRPSRNAGQDQCADAGPCPHSQWRLLPEGLPEFGQVLLGSPDWSGVLLEEYARLEDFLETLRRWEGGPSHWRLPPDRPLDGGEAVHERNVQQAGDSER